MSMPTPVRPDEEAQRFPGAPQKILHYKGCSCVPGSIRRGHGTAEACIIGLTLDVDFLLGPWARGKLINLTSRC